MRTIPEEIKSRLTKTEFMVFMQLAEGMCVKDIAAQAGREPKTIECHKWNLMGKLGVHTTAGLVHLGIASGLVEATLPEGLF